MARRIISRKLLRLLIGTIALGLAITLFGHGDILDTRFYYSGEFAQVFFSLLTQEQAQAYLRGAILDLVFIHFYSSLVWHLFTELLGESKLRVIALLPSVLDLIETGSIIIILISGMTPQNLDWLGLTTAAKWTSATIVFLWWLLLFFSRRRQSHRSF